MELHANPGYAVGKAQAIQQRPDDKRISDEANLTKRQQHASQWLSLFERMTTGQLNIGSRKPMVEIPVWATPEVMKGGFATGDLLAALKPEDKPNSAWTFPQLIDLLESGLYRIRLPEHGALLVSAWLVQKGRTDECERLLTQLSPLMGKLRFYPDTVPADGPGECGPVQITTELFAQTAGELMEQLDSRRRNANNMAINRIQVAVQMQVTLSQWFPLRQEIFTLIGETIECAHWPSFKKHCTGKKRIVFDDQLPSKPVFLVHSDCKFFGDSCGWPCQRIPDGWMERATELYQRVQTFLDRTDKRKLPSLKPNETNRVLIKCLKNVVTNKGFGNLTGKQVGMLRLKMAGHEFRRGLADSKEAQDYSSRIRQILDRTIFGTAAIEVVNGVIDRIRRLDPERGLSQQQLEFICRPLQIPSKPGAEVTIPRSLAEKILRSKEDSLDRLLQQKLLGSGETLAAVIPSLVAQMVIQKLPDISLQRLTFSLHKAFSKRRSLMLLTLESQVRMEELPWMQPILQAKSNNSVANQEAAFDALKRVAQLYLKHFPQTIIPNKLTQSLKSLAESASLQVPFTEELAADIFMGQFTNSFVHAARLAAQLLQGSLYERYYKLESIFRKFATADVSSTEFFQACLQLSPIQESARNKHYWRSPAENGTIIEQQQIITTHNLAALVKYLSLGDSVDWLDCAMNTWKWIVIQAKIFAVENPKIRWIIRLRTRKNTAYAWRQLIFYLTMKQLAEPQFPLAEFLFSMESEFADCKRFSKQERNFLNQQLLAPLHLAVRSNQPMLENHQPFLGWNS